MMISKPFGASTRVQVIEHCDVVLRSAIHADEAHHSRRRDHSCQTIASVPIATSA
jgi:hypothetical protein